MLKKITSIILAGVLTYGVYTQASMTQIHAEEAPSTYATQRTTEFVSISTAISDSPYTRKFSINNLTGDTLHNVKYYTSVDGTPRYIDIAPYGKAELPPLSTGSAKGLNLYVEYDVQVYVQASNDAYAMPVRYIMEGNVVSETYVTNRYGVGATCTAPKTWKNEKNPNALYQVSGANYKQVPFGTEVVEFTYSRVDRKPFSSIVSYVDQDGNGLGKDSFTVTEEGGSFTPLASITAPNGRQYKLMNGQGAVSQTYNEGVKNYTFRYQLQESNESRPYFITVKYMAGSTLLTSQTLTVTKGNSVTANIPATYTTTDGTEYKLVSGEPKTITHKFAQGAKNYTVRYEKNVTDRNQPYNIRINMIDLLTGRVLDTKSANVGLNKTVDVAIDASMRNGDTTYTLAANQPNNISHKFGSEQRVYNVYYTEKGQEVKAYDVTIVYFDITNNKVLSSRTEKAELDKTLTISVPKTVKEGEKTFTLLNGQNSNAQHDFYTARRRYVYFYRDVEDKANEETVVTPDANGGNTVNPVGENVITVDNEGALTVTTPQGNQVLDEDNNLVNDDPTNNPNNQDNPNQGDNPTNPDDPEQNLEDNPTPLANGKGNKTDMIAWTAGGIVTAAALFGLLFFFLKKKKAKKENEA